MYALSDRDTRIVQHVTRFKQMTSNHLHELLYHTLTSRTPCNRALRRLTDLQYLARIERRIAGGTRGGSGQYVYQLGRRGYYLYQTGRYQPARAISHHALAIVDCYVEFKRGERAGKFSLMGVSTEPDCWRVIGGIELKPDLYIDVQTGAERRRAWLEVDMGTEAQRQLRGKLEAYWRAYQEAHELFPVVVWVGVDYERAKELAWLISQMPEPARRLFVATTRERLVPLFS